jgi:Predicted RNA methylase
MFKMRKSELEIELEKVPAIAKPKSKLEQYSISSDVAAQLCIEAQMRGQ